MRTYKRYSTRLRFEVGEAIPEVGACWEARTSIGGVRKKVHLLKIRDTFPHPDEPGVILMDAYISTSAC